MDPQQRIMIEQTFEAMSTAHLAPDTNNAQTQTGVYIGCMFQEYLQAQVDLGLRMTAAIATGNGISYLVGRVSYIFDFGVRTTTFGFISASLPTPFLGVCSQGSSN